MKNPTIALVCLLLAGCATAPNVRLSGNDHSAITTVAIDPNVKMPEEMFFSGRAQAFAAGIGGLVGGLVGAAGAKKPAEQILAAMDAKGISVPDLVKAEFANQINQAGRLRLVPDKSNADAELTLMVNSYGLGQTQGLSSRLYPLINLTATLRRKDDGVAWQQTASVTPLNSENKIGKTFDEYLADPELLKATFANVAAIVSRKLLEELGPGTASHR